MSAADIKASILHARRFMRRANLLDAPVRDVSTALAHHGYVQIDPLNVCGRMHDLILRNRVAGYREGDLMRHLHGDEEAVRPAVARTAFEHHLPGKNILVAFSHDAWPHLLAEMRARARRTGAWSGKLTAREKEFAPSVLAELAARGPLSAEDLHDGRRSFRGWGASSLAKSTLQKLFFHGRVLIAARRSQRRCYALPENVLSAASLAQPAATAADTERWLTLLKLRQHRLVTLTKAEFARVEDQVRAVTVEDGPKRLFCLRTDAALFDDVDSASVREGDAAKADLRLLAPLDPLIYNRKLTAELWGFGYTWEVYTPASKRVRGYYALPVLAGDELIGHIDPKVDRAAGKLIVQNRSLPRGYSAAAAMRELAAFLGVK